MTKPCNFNSRKQARRQGALSRRPKDADEAQTLRERLSLGNENHETKKQLANASYARRERHSQRARLTR